MSKGRVLVAMSGGVDSSVCALLLARQGYECVGCTMRLATSEDEADARERTCCSLDDVEDAREVCWRLGIRHHTFDYTERFGRDVIEPFVRAYEAGDTPNPCVACNRHLKFGALLDRARELGCDWLATGHYARVEHAGGRWHLLRGVDAAKDQSYFLYSLGQERLAHVLFPLGGLVKATQVRAIAEQEGLVSARKRDSEGVCFLPDGDHLSFIERYRGRRVGDGDVLDERGRVVGRHHGALRYTLGQRKGLGVSCAAGRTYVVDVNVADNTVTLGGNEALMGRELTARDCLWVSGHAPSGAVRCAAKIRYHQPDQPCSLEVHPCGSAHVVFDGDQRAITAGQAVVFYDGDEVLGGGTIARG